MLQGYDPIELARETEKIVTEGNKRRYNTFRFERFYRGIATARGVGCNLRCGFCWINPSRDEPENHGRLYSPAKVHEALSDIHGGCHVRITGCEPTIGRAHLLEFIEICRDNRLFDVYFLETNGILLGADESYVQDLAKFKDYVFVRLSIKAGTPEAFEMKTGAGKEFFELPFMALSYLRKHGISHRVASMTQDPALTSSDERRCLLARLAAIDIEEVIRLEEEKTDLFGITRERLLETGIVADVDQVGMETYQGIDMKSVLITCETLHMAPSDVISSSIMRTLKSCKNQCTKCNPYCGHGVHDDLDPILG